MFENFKELFNQDKRKVKNIIKLVTKEENEDLEQEVYLKAYKNREKYNECGKFSSWLATIAYNVSRDYLKSAKNKNELLADDNVVFLNVKDKKQTPENALVQRERQEIIIAAINSLNKKHKEAILLFEIDNLSYEEIAKKLKCPMGTVKSRIYNAKKELYEKLKDLI